MPTPQFLINKRKYPYSAREMLHKKYKNNIDIVTALANSLLERPIKEVVHEFKKLGLTTVVLSQDKNFDVRSCLARNPSWQEYSKKST